MKQKGFSAILILVGIFLAVIIAGGAFYFGKSQSVKPTTQNPVVTSQTPQSTLIPSPSSTPNETASWKAYTSTDGHYTVRYPNNFTLHVNEVHEFETNNYLPTKDTIELDSPTAGVIPFITIKHQIILSNTSLSDYINKNSGCLEVTADKGVAITIDGFNAKEYYNSGCGVAGASLVYVIANNYAYSIDLNGNVDKNFLDSFLSVIQFTK